MLHLPRRIIVQLAAFTVIALAVLAITFLHFVKLPTILLDPDVTLGINATNSKLTIDGIVLDARTNTEASFTAISLDQTPATIKGLAVIGPDVSGSTGIQIDGSGLAKAISLSVSGSAIAGYSSAGVRAIGPVKLTVTGSVFDASDGGRMAASIANGVEFTGVTLDVLSPTGSVSKSTLLHHYSGVLIRDSSKIKVSSNSMIDNQYGVAISANGQHRADGNSITGNTIVGIPSNWTGIGVYDNTPTTPQISKTVISKNTLVSAEFDASGAVGSGIFFSITPTGATTPTGTLSGNLFIGFASDKRVTNFQGHALIVEKSTNSLP